METLLLISGELLILPTLIAAAIVFELASGLLLAFVQLGLGPLRRRRARSSAVMVRIPGLSLLRRVRSGLVTLCGAVLLLTLAADLFFFEAALRWALSRLEEHAGLVVGFDRARGSFLAGRVELEGLEIARDEAGGDGLELAVERFELDVAMFEVLSATKRVQQITVVGAKGRFERRAVGGASGVTRAYEVDELALDDIELRFVDHTRDRPIDVQLAIERLRVAPLRSQMALFDLLYRTNARGSVDGHAFEATSVEDASGRTTVWRAPRLPLALVVPYLGAGSRWIEGGDVEVEVTDRWLTAQRPPEISMHYKVVLRDLDVSFPDDLSPKEKALALPLALAIEKLGREIPLEFELELSEERFRGAASLEAVGLWQAASGALARAMVEETGIEPDALRRWGKLGVGLLEKAIEEE